MYEPRSIFWPVFWAVLAAWAVTVVIKWGFGLLLAAGLVAGLRHASQQPATTPGHLPARPGLLAPPEPEPLRLPGPLVAVRDGRSRACINGVVADRMANGWRQRPGMACEATSN